MMCCTFDRMQHFTSIEKKLYMWICRVMLTNIVMITCVQILLFINRARATLEIWMMRVHSSLSFSLSLSSNTFRFLFIENIKKTNESYNHQIELLSDRMNSIEMHLNRERIKHKSGPAESRHCSHSQLWFIFENCDYYRRRHFLVWTQSRNQRVDSRMDEVGRDHVRESKLIVLILEKFTRLAAMKLWRTFLPFFY